MSAGLRASVLRWCLLLRLCGAFPVRSVEHTFKLSGLRLFVSSVVVFFLAGLWYSSMDRRAFNENIIGTVSFAHDTILLSVMPMAVFWTVMSTKKFNRLLKELTLIDDSLTRFGANCEDRANVRFILAHVSAFCWVLAATLAMGLDAVDWLHTLFTIVPTMATVLFVAQLLRLVGKRFSILAVVSLPVPSTLSYLASVYAQLWKLSKDLNSLFNPHLMSIIASAFGSMIIHLYYIMLFVQNHYNFPIIAWRMGWMIMYVTFAVDLVSACYSTSNQAKEFNNKLYQLMIDDRTNKLSNDKNLRLHIAMKRDVTFTAYGFFNLDYSLVHSMVAAAATYLVILIQFGMPTASSPPPQGNATAAPNVTDIPATSVAA